MLKVFEEAVKQALRFFGGGGGAGELAKGAEKVLKTAAKVARKVK